MSGRETRLLLGVSLSAWSCAFSRVLAQALDDVQLQQSAAVAALGFALGPLLAALRPPPREPRAARRRLAWSTTLYALLLLGASATWVRLAHGLTPVFGASGGAGLLLALPLCVGGYALAAAGPIWPALAGAAAGAALALPALELLGAAPLLAQACLVAALAALLCARAPHVERRDPVWSLSGVAFLAALLAALDAHQALPLPEQGPPLGRLAALRAHLSQSGVRLIPQSSRWDGYGHLQVFTLAGKPAGAGRLGLLARDSAPLSGVVRGNGNSTEDALQALCEGTLLSEPYARPRPRVLLAGFGGGLELQCALRRGAQHVDVAEPSAALRAAIGGELDRLLHGAATDPRVQIHAASARSLARRTHGYDLVLIAARGHKHRLSAGVLPVPEALLPTDAALADLIGALAPDGVLSAIVQGEPAALRFASTAFSALRLLDQPKPDNHIVVHQSGNAYALLIKRKPLELDEVLALHERNRERRSVQTDPLLLDLFEWPLDSPALRYTPGAGFQNRFGELFARASRPGVPPMQKGYVFDISVASDDRPLFFELTRCARSDTYGAQSACAALPRLAGLWSIAALGLLLLLGLRVRASAVGPGLRELLSLACSGAALTLGFALLSHLLAIFAAVSARGFVLAALGMLGGAAFALARRRPAAQAAARRTLADAAMALVVLALLTTGLAPVLAVLSARGALLWVVAGAPAAAALGFTLAQSARALVAGEAPEPSARRATAGLAAITLGAAAAVPAAAALPLLADYNALSAVAALLLALPTVLALRRPQAAA